MFSDEWISYKYNGVTITGIEADSANSNSIYSMLILDKNDTNIVVMHGQESKYAFKDKAEIINLTELKNRNIDYLALGHIHSYKYEKLDSRGAYCYSGCLEGRGFDEFGDKGFVLLNIRDKKISHEFIKFARRTFYEIHVDISNAYTSSQIEEVINNSLTHISWESLVKIILEGEFEIDSEKDMAYITQKLSEEFYFVKIYDKSKLSINIEDYKYDVSLKSEFIRLVLNARMSDEDKNEIIMNGINALSGEDID